MCQPSVRFLRRIVGFMMIMFLCCSSKTYPQESVEPNRNSSENSDAPVLLAPVLPPVLHQGFDAALRAMAVELPDGKSAPLRLQLHPQKGDALVILLVTEKGGARGSISHPSVPEICGVLDPKDTQPVVLCDGQGECGPLDRTVAPTIVCNLKYISKLQTLLYVMHSPAFIDAMRQGDWAFSDLLLSANENPAKALDNAEEVDTDHMVNHMVFLALFLIAHEVRHILDGQVGGNFSHDEAGPPTPSLRTAIICRNSQEFGRQGWSMFGKPDIVKIENESADPQRTVDQKLEELIKKSRAVWKSERAADSYAANYVASVVNLLNQESHTQTRNFEYAIQSIGMIALDGWYERLGLFLSTYCNDLRDKDYPVMRCMCRDHENYRRIAALFNDTHPPIYLRAEAALSDLEARLNLSDATRDSQAVIRSWFSIFRGLMDTPLKMAFGACREVEISNALTKDGKVFMVYPDLKGFFESGGSYTGWPPKEKEMNIMSECIRPARSGLGAPDSVRQGDDHESTR